MAPSFTRVALVAVLVAGCTAVSAGTANAAGTATIRYSGADILFLAAGSQANRLVITAPRPGFLVFDDVVNIEAFTEDPFACLYFADADGIVRDRTRIQCEDRGGRLNIRTGNYDDLIDNRTTALVETLSGDDGNDTIRLGGAPGVVVFASGGDGNDVFYSGAGSDVIDGGEDVDTVSYAGRFGAVTADLDAPYMWMGIRFAGHGGMGAENDGFNNIENLTGGGGDDLLTGNSRPNVLDGGSATVPCGTPPCATFSGNDRLVGGNGADVLLGRDGNDLMWGGVQFDTMDGGTGSNTCYDTLAGASTTNCVFVVLVSP
jgi:Ca2+-binding RTX toxin-like protein